MQITLAQTYGSIAGPVRVLKASLSSSLKFLKYNCHHSSSILSYPSCSTRLVVMSTTLKAT